METHLVRPLQSLLDLLLDDVIGRVYAANVVDGLGLAANALAELDCLLREAIRRNLGVRINLHPEDICEVEDVWNFCLEQVSK